MTLVVKYDEVADTRGSSALDGLYWDESQEVAYVVFPGSGVFSYNDVTRDTWQQWLQWGSLGRFYHLYIKNDNPNRENHRGSHVGYFNDVVFEKKVATNGVVYVFTGTITQVISGDVEVSDGSNSLERALAAFKAQNPGVEVTGITTKPRA